MEQLIATPVTARGADPRQAPPVLRHRHGRTWPWRWRWGSTSSTCRCAEASPSSSGSPRSSSSAPSPSGCCSASPRGRSFAASQLAMAFTFLPSYLLSGFVFSIDSMPRAVRAVTYLVPSRYFVKVIKGIYLKGVGLETLAVDTALLLVFGAAWRWPRPGCSARSSGRGGGARARAGPTHAGQGVPPALPRPADAAHPHPAPTPPDPRLRVRRHDQRPERPRRRRGPRPDRLLPRPALPLLLLGALPPCRGDGGLPGGRGPDEPRETWG